MGKATLMHRFYVPPGQINGNELVFSPEISRQIVHVLRLSIGEAVSVFDGSGRAWTAQLTEVKGKEVRATLGAVSTPNTESPLRISLYQALLKREHHELIWQKGTELGVTRFVPLVTARSVVREQHHWQKKLSRWQRIIREAAEQCGRVRLPEIVSPLAFTEIWPLPENGESLCLFATLATSVRWSWDSLPATFPDVRHVRLFIGPEGDFSPAESALAEEQGCFAVSLGQRVLRSETAAIALLTLVQQAWGDLG